MKECQNYTLAPAEIIDLKGKHTLKLPMCQPAREITPCLGRKELCINPIFFKPTCNLERNMV